MKILKPPWVNHNGKPLYSIDVHPDGSRFVTGGQGESSGRITIWNVLPLTDASKEADSAVPKLLCQMDNHFACVNCVRWSHNGAWLASAGDDKLIMIWRYAGGMSKTFGSDQENMETWRCVHTLRGHSGDVLDLSWSPTDQYLASCSVDNSVIVWNAQKFPDQIKVLTGHVSMVKGVTWDPIGKYLASQSDDKSIIIWRTRDWTKDMTITKPFEESSGTTHVLRLGWSPDGSYMVSAHAMNNKGPTAQIISRSGWSTNMDFVGHRKAVTCVRFNPLLLSRSVKKGEKEKSVNYCCCAVGSRDSSCSIWLTALKRPLVVLHDLFDNSILDMSWNSKGTQLFICSSDGTIAYVEFSSTEIGLPVKEEDKTKLLSKMYGSDVVLNGIKGTQIIENADLLKLHQKKLDIPNGNHESSQPATNSTKILNGHLSPVLSSNKSIEKQHSNSSQQTPTKQIESRTKDGRRRITPIFLSPLPVVAELSNHGQTVFTTTNQMSSIVIEHASSDDQLKLANTNEVLNGVNTEEKMAEPINEMAVINPMTSAEAKHLSPKKAKKPQAEPSRNRSRVIEESDSDGKEMEEKEAASKIAVKRKSNLQLLSKKRKDVPESPEVQSHIPQPSSIAPAAAQYSTPVAELPVPDVQKSFTYQFLEDSLSVNISVNNGVAVSGTRALHKVTCYVNGKAEWTAMLNHQVLEVKCSRSLVCMSCTGRSLVVYNINGQRLIPNIVKDSDISLLTVCNSHCMVITKHALLSHWDFSSMRCITSDLDLSSFLSLPGHQCIQQAFLTKTFMPCVRFSDSSSYIYHNDLKTWLFFTNAVDSVLEFSHQDSVNPIQSTNNGVVLSIRSQLGHTPKGLTRLYKSDPVLQQQCTLSFIQNQMAMCRTIGSSSEYRIWLLAYVRYLTHMDAEPVLREICSQCTNIVYKSKSSVATSSSSYSNSQVNHLSQESHQTLDQNNTSSYIDVTNLDKVKLLEDILLIIAMNLKLQRLYTEYRDLLDIMIQGQG